MRDEKGCAAMGVQAECLWLWEKYLLRTPKRRCMSSPSTLERFRHHAVPLVLVVIVAITVLVVPPLVLGDLTARTYSITAAVLILAITTAFPYAVLVAVGTLPLLYFGIASYAAPQTPSDPGHSFSSATALRHVFAGVSYVLGAAVVGVVGLGVQLAAPPGATMGPAALQPSFLLLGGLIVAGTFVGAQLWRYDTPHGTLPRQTVLGTAALGVLLAVSPAIAYWVFGNTFG